MAVQIKPTASAQFIGQAQNSSNLSMIGLVASSSGTGRRWRMRYTFEVGVQMASFDVVMRFTTHLGGKMSAGVTSSLSSICPREVYFYMSGTTATAHFDRELTPGTYFLWIDYCGSTFETTACSRSNVTVNAVPAASTLTADNGTLGEAQTLTVNAGSDEFTHDVLYSVGSASGTVAAGVGAGELTWTPPLTLAEQNTAGKAVTCKYTVVTYVNGTENARAETDVSYAIPESCAPTVAITAAPVNGSLSARFDGLYVQGRSRLQLTYDVETRYGASVSGYKTTLIGTVEHRDNPWTSDILTTTGELAVRAEVSDSRGYSSGAETAITVLPYASPAMAPVSGESTIVCGRATDDGVMSDRGTRLRIRVGKRFSPVAGANRCLLRYRITEDGGTAGAWVTLLDMGSAETEVSLLTEDTLEPTKAYTVELNVTDDVGEAMTLTFRIPTLDVPLHLGYGGQNMGLGRYADYSEPYRIDVGWKMQLDSGVRIIPYPGEEGEVLAALGYEPGRLLFHNVAVTAASFVVDTTYADFPYRAAVALTGALATMTPEVTFSVADAVSGVFAPVAECYDGGVYIYAAEVPAADITVPTVILWR